MKTVEDEVHELLRHDIALELEIDQITADEIKPRKEERKWIRDRLKALMTSESKDQVLMEFAAKDAVGT